jgi:hypothetical protein
MRWRAAMLRRGPCAERRAHCAIWPLRERVDKRDRKMFRASLHCDVHVRYFRRTSQLDTQFTQLFGKQQGFEKKHRLS